jgi:hypothetical protein
MTPTVTYEQSMLDVIAPKRTSLAGFDFPEAAPVNAYPVRADVPYQLDLPQYMGLPATPEQLQSRGKIYRLEAALYDHAVKVGGVDAPTGLDVRTGPEPVHTMTPGVYVRELTIPAGMVVVPKRHAREHVCKISKGRATVFTEDGVTEVVAPYTFVSPAGSKRVLLVREEITWATIHRTDFSTLDEIMRDIIIEEGDDLIRQLAVEPAGALQ